MTGPAARRRVGNAYTDAGLLVPPILTDDVVRLVEAGPRKEAVTGLLTRYPDLGRGLAAQLVDLAREALNL